MFIVPAIAIGMSCCADLPPGFERVEVADELNQPIALDFLPDGRLLVAERTGSVVVVDHGVRSTLLTLTDLATDQEWGLLGMAVDPQFGVTGWIYVYYISASLEARVGRFTVEGVSADLESEVVLWQNPQPATGATHHGGSLAFAPDGTLFIATGEETQTQWSQDMSSARGKILRINRDGTVPVDNPFSDTPGYEPRIFAAGFRNPFRISVDPSDGTLYVGDVGFFTWEEINRVGPATNGGWPGMEGPQCYTPDCSGYLEPVWAYGHCHPVYAPDCQAAVIAGPVYRGGVFPPDYEGNLFVAEFLNGWIRRLVFDENGAVAHEEVFAAGEDLFSIVDMKVGPDGDLYYVCIYLNPEGGQKVFRITYTGGSNHAPAAVALADPTHGPDAPLTVRFNGAASTDSDSPSWALRYTWDFGDGSSSTEAAPQHTFTARGRYTVSLTVSDGDLSDSTEVDITVGSAPIPIIHSPLDEYLYRAGDVLSFSGSALDAEDGSLPAADLTWWVEVVHEAHTHPVLGPLPGVSGGSFVVPTTGHEPEHVHFRVTLRAVDSDGIATLTRRDVQPVVSGLSLSTIPEGVALYLDGNPLATPRDYESVVNFEHTLSAPGSAVVDGVPHYFSAWLDGELSPVRGLIAPEGGASMTAVFEPYCPSDFNVDRFVTGDDFDAWTAAFEAGDPAADFNQDSFVTGDDFDGFMDAFIAGC